MEAFTYLMLLAAPEWPSVLHALLIIEIHRDLKVGVAHEGMADHFDAMISGMTGCMESRRPTLNQRVEHSFNDPKAMKRVLVRRDESRIILQPGVLFGKERYQLQTSWNTEWGVLMQANIRVCSCMS